MYRALVIAFFSILYLIVTPGFHCGGSPLDNCTSFKTDTAILPFTITNAASVYHINDTIKFFSDISDTIHSAGGDNFIYPLNTLYANIILYKVIANGSSAQLNYATNEFNALVEAGSFQNTGGTGFQILYNRILPFNKLSAMLVPGSTGLYLITVNLNTYSAAYDLDLNNNSDRCTRYKGIADIPASQQQKQFWDSLGTTTLVLANSNYNYITKDRRNYFFVNVIP